MEQASRSVPGAITVAEERADAEPGATLLEAMAAELDALYADRPGRLDSIPATPGQMAPPHGRFLVAYRDGRPLACGGLKRLELDGGPSAEIKRMYVVPSERGHGLGALILTELEDRARALGYTRARLDTGPRQDAARRIYERAGYEEIADYNGNPYAAHWFEKPL